jgi:hypothetical protein
VPRIVNVICDAALVFGFAEDRRTVDLALVEEVLGELDVTGVLPPPGATNMTESAPTPTPALAGVGPAGVPAGSSQPLHEDRVAGPLQQDLGRRSAELDRREQAVRRRERELAEQRRILAEEYRLLRSRPAAAAPADAPPQPVRLQVQAPLREASDHPGTLWQRLKRTVIGASSPAME